MTEKKTPAKDKNTSNQEASLKKLAEKNSATKKPDPKAEQAQADSEKSQSASQPSNILSYLLIIVVLIISGGGLYFLWQKQQQDFSRQLTSVQNIEQQISDFKQQQQLAEQLKQQLVELANSNKQKIDAINNSQQNLHNNLTKLVQDNHQLRTDWLMAEAEYLIQIANHRILLEKDVATAIVALKAADTRLAEISDPSLLRIRKVLANDIQSLNNIKQADLAGLSVKITAIGNNIPKLPLNTPDPKTYTADQEATPKESGKLNSLKDLPAAMWKDIKSLIVVRNHQKPLQPLLAPSQHFFLLQNLALTLEQARLALLNGDNEIFQERLASAEMWINDYFDTEHNVSRNILATIKEMRETDINPDLPDISSTYSLIKKYRLDGQQPKLPAANVNEKS